MKWNRPKTEEELLEYVRLFFQFDIPHIVNPHCSGHCTPFDMLKYIWFDTYDSMVCIGCRDGYKTLTLGVSEVMELVFKGVGTVHIGAIEEQAKKCYSYVRKYLGEQYAAAVSSSIMSRTYLKNGGNLQIIPCTMTRVNSPHEPKVRFDELELADPAAYADAKGIPSSDQKGNQPSVVYTTTRKFAFGLAQREIDTAKRLGLPVLMWCFLDITERCPDSRSGTKKHKVWVNRTTFNWAHQAPKEAIALAKDKHLVVGKETDSWVEFDVFDKCFECPILPTCCGRLKKSHGCKPIRDIIVKFRSTTIEFWQAQMECRNPSKKGLVCWAFDEDIHATNFEIPDNWRTLGWLMVCGKDFNYTPQATLLCFVTESVLYVYDEIYIEQGTVERCALTMNRMWFDRYGRPEGVICDFTRPDSIADLKAHNVSEAMPTMGEEVESGVDLLNMLFNPVTIVAGGMVRPLIVIHKRNCAHLIDELKEGYRRKIDADGNPTTIIPKNNHYVDCLRYVCWRWMRRYMAMNEEAVPPGGLYEAEVPNIRNRTNLLRSDA